MPTVIALDVSLSMCRPIPGNYPPDMSDEEIPTRKKLAVEAINQFLDHIQNHNKLEFVSLISFSSDYQVLASFTRDLDFVRTHLISLPDFDKTNFNAILEGVSIIVHDSWGSSVPINVLLVTDGNPGFGSGSLSHCLKVAKKFPFPVKMNILSLSDPDDKNYSENCHMLSKLIETVASGDGGVYFPENHLTSKGCYSAIMKLCNNDFTPYKGFLKCGQLSSRISLCPPPQPFTSRSENEKRFDISDTIDIIGFIDSNDFSSPPAHSRHLILPLKSTDGTFHSLKSEEIEDDSEANNPNFCVLLHGALKIENLCAFCEVGNEWFGFIYSWADNKKKSNLMLSILPPGAMTAPWLGNLKQLGPKDELICPKNTIMPSFPKILEKKSYTSNPTVWTSNQGLNLDIQRLLRQARKLPEKSVQFYKELERIRRWAITIAFEEILTSIADILERECMTLSNSHVQIELSHAAAQLKEFHNRPLYPYKNP